MKNLFSSVVLFCISFILCSQSSSIQGTVLNYENNLPVNDLRVILLDTTFSILDTSITNSYGQYQFIGLDKKSYCIKVLDVRQILMTDIKTKEKDTVFIDFKAFSPCDSSNTDGICPVCKKHENIASIEPYTVVSKSFKTKRATNRAWRKVQRRGYDSYYNDEGEEVIINMLIKSLIEDFENPCNNWFCRRDKIIF